LNNEKEGIAVCEMRWVRLQLSRWRLIQTSYVVEYDDIIHVRGPKRFIDACHTIQSLVVVMS
jgi:hypothetical protein